MARRVISAVLKFKDENFSSGIRRANSEAGDFGRAMNVVQNKVEGFSKSATNAFKAVGAAAGTLAVIGITALGASVAGAVLDMDESFNLLQAQTGASAEDMKRFESTAKEVFSAGYGDGLNDVTSAIANIKQNMHGLNAGELQAMTKDAMAFGKIFDADINEVTRASNNMMSAFGVTAKTSMDMFTAGAQRGLNFSDEMLDNVAEYAPLFGEMGYSAEEYFGILERGSKAGVYNLDYVNDVMKEFQIRVKDGSKGTSDAMGAMSADTRKVWQEFMNGNGTVSDVASTVVAELKTMEDQVAAGQLAVSLFGTKWEDLESDAMYAMLGTTEAMTDFEGAMDSASASIEKSFKNRLISSWRKLSIGVAEVVNGSGAQDFLGAVATKAEELVPKVVAVAEKAFALGNTIKTHWTPIRETVIGITVAVAAFKTGMVAMTIVSTVTGFIQAYRAALGAGTVAQWAMNVAMSANPIGAVVTAIAALVGIGVVLYRNWDTVTAKTKEFWSAIGGLEGALRIVTGPIGVVIGAAIDLAKNWDSTKSVWENVWGAMARSAAATVNSVIGGINSMISAINSIPGVNVPIVAKVDWGSAPQNVSGVADFRKIEGSYAVGSNRIERDQVAQIHKDEMILPARQAQRVRAAGGNIDNIDKLVSQQKQVVTVSSSQNAVKGQGAITVVIENITAAGVTVAELATELVAELKLKLANM